MTEPETTAPTPYRPGLADVIFLLVCFSVVSNASKGLLDDPGLGWHLRNLDAMIAQGGWLTVDPFTEPRDGPRAWYTNQWLGEVPFYVGWKLAGNEGIAVVAALIIAFIVRCLYQTFIHDGLPWPMALLWALIAGLGTSCSWVARPNLFTVLFALITARTLLLFHEGRLTRRATLWLLVVFAVWANTHGGFLAGIILIILALGAEAMLAVMLLEEEKRTAAVGRLKHLGMLAVGLVAATLFNPYGVFLYRHALGLLGDDYFMNLHMEWKTPDFRAAGAMRYELFLLLFPFLLAVTRRRTPIFELVLSLAWLHLALTGYRYVSLWVVVAASTLARASMDIPYLHELARRWQLNAGEGSPFFTRPGATPWVWSVVVAVALCGWACATQGRFIHHGKDILAAEAMDELIRVSRQWQQDQGRRPIIFHSYDWGGYLTWHGWPHLLNWIDDRNEVQGRERVEEYFAIARCDPGWQVKLRDVDLVCISSELPLAKHLARESETWQKIDYPGDDGRAVLYQRRDSRPNPRQEAKSR